MKNEAAKNPPITRIWRTFVTSRQGSTLGKEASLFFNQGFFFGFDQGTDASDQRCGIPGQTYPQAVDK